MLWTRSQSLAETTAGGETELVWGDAELPERLGELDLRISAEAFFQTNTEMAELLYGVVGEYAALQGWERVYDLYCGIGTIALTLAPRAGELWGIELVEEAVADAIASARRNDVTNTHFFAGDTRLALPELVARAGRPDVLVRRSAPRRALQESPTPHRRVLAQTDRVRLLQPHHARPQRGRAGRGRLDAEEGAPRGHVPPNSPHRVRRPPGARVGCPPMRAATIRDKQIVIEEHPDPVPGAGEVLVRVRAAGLNGADMMQRRGLYPAPAGSPQDIPGMELAGEVAALGAGAERFGEGERVMAVVGGGGQAELVRRQRACADAGAGGARLARCGRAARGVHDRPRRDLHPGAAASRRASARARRRGRRGRGGDPAGRGHGRARDRDRAGEQLRAQVAALRAEVIPCEGFAEHGPYDVILELVGAPNMPENLTALATGGRICVIGVSAGAKSELNLLALMAARARIHGSTLRARTLEEKALTARRLEHEVLPLFDSGALRVPVAATYPLGGGRRRL